jgi:cytochrome c peroxidase
MACGTCHRPGAGGSDPRASQASAIHPGQDGLFGTEDDRRGAQGIKRCTDTAGVISYKADATFGLNVQVTSRKPPTYLDAMFAADLFWDGRARSQFIDPDTSQVAIASGGGLESQAVGPPMNDAEMACENRKWPSVHAKLATAQPLQFARDIPTEMLNFIASYPTYPKMFGAAFGTEEINTKRIAFAIATHERRLTSHQTPWDRWNAGDDTAMTPAQVRGFELFMGAAKCHLCHAPPLFSDAGMAGVPVNAEFHNIGFFDEDPNFDNGREKVTGDPAHRGAIKTPSLRNVGLREAGGLLHTGTGPGADLLAMMQAHKSPPFLDGPTVDPLMGSLDITDQDISDINDFMRNALTDPRVKAETTPFDRPKLGSE